MLYSFKGGTDGGQPTGGIIFDTQGTLYSTTTAGSSASAGTVFKLTPPANAAGTWTETVLYNFLGGTDGAGPQASLILDTNGALYGTTTHGGSANAGTVFRLTPPASGSSWTESLLYSFKGGSDGFGQGQIDFRRVWLALRHHSGWANEPAAHGPRDSIQLDAPPVGWRAVDGDCALQPEKQRWPP